MSDIFREIRESEKRFDKDFATMQTRIRWGWRLLALWAGICLLGAAGMVYVVAHYASKFW
jgi:hypothetical protein